MLWAQTRKSAAACKYIVWPPRSRGATLGADTGLQPNASLDTAGVRCLKPTWKSWPSWLDVFPNHTNAPRIEACTLVMHVSLQSL